jgi:hypothetical protein
VARKSGREAGGGSSVRKRSRKPALNVKPEVALASTRNIREIDSLTPAFVRWYAGQQYRTDVRVVLQHLTGFFHDYPESNRTGPITALEPTEVAPEIATLILDSVNEGVIASICLHEFLLFLRDSGRWTGTRVGLQEAVHLGLVHAGEGAGRHGGQQVRVCAGGGPRVAGPLIRPRQPAAACSRWGPGSWTWHAPWSPVRGTTSRAGTAPRCSARTHRCRALGAGRAPVRARRSIRVLAVGTELVRHIEHCT